VVLAAAEQLGEAGKLIAMLRPRSDDHSAIVTALLSMT